MADARPAAIIRYLALDHGARRIGVAVADGETRMAFARPAIMTRGADAAAQQVAQLARAEGASCVIIGLPLHADGGEGEQATAVRAFGARLTSLGLAVEFHDERLSSWQASTELAASGASAERHSGTLDSAAARIILQDYLDSKETP
ncbi:MAG: Holliday junction resolvase RuvX [Chloroflexota bacterium]